MQTAALPDLLIGPELPDGKKEIFVCVQNQKVKLLFE